MFALAFVWVIVIPMLIGLLLELTIIVHFRIALHQSPCVPLHQDWALGLLFLKLWVRLVLIGGPSWCAMWRSRFERVLNDGFTHLDACRIFSTVISPLTLNLLLLLGVPYVTVKGAMWMLCSDRILIALAVRFSYAAAAGLYVLYRGICTLRKLLTYIHNSARDNRYLIGRRLHNIDELLMDQAPSDHDASKPGRSAS